MIKLNFSGADQRPPALYEFGKDPKEAFASPKYASLIGCHLRAENIWPPHCESERDTMASTKIQGSAQIEAIRMGFAITIIALTFRAPSHSC